MSLWTRLFGPRRSRIVKRWVLRRRVIERDPFGKTIPKWADHLAIGGFREQGWNAYDQRQHGKVIASGKWGESIYLMSDGAIACTATLPATGEEGAGGG